MCFFIAYKSAPQRAAKRREKIKMKFTLKKDIIQDAMQKLRSVLSNKTTIPVLAGIKVEALESCIMLTASNASESIVHRILPNEGSVVIEATGAAVFTKESLEVATKLSGEITYELVDQNLNVTKGKKTSLSFTTMAADDYPKITTDPKTQNIKLSGQRFSDLISRTVYAVSKSDARPVLTGVNLQIGANLQATSTDSHRLAKVTIPLEDKLEEVQVTIPGKMLDHALKAFDLANDVFLAIEPSQIAMANGNTIYYSRLLEGTFPETDRLIPTEYQSALTVDTKEFVESLQLLESLSSQGVVKLDVGGLFVNLEAKNETAKGRREIAYMEFTGDEGFTISFSSGYLLEALKRIDTASIKLNFCGNNRPFTVEGIEDVTDQVQLILPVRTY